MNIYVCIKQVPDTTSNISLKSDKSGIETDGIKWILNPYDEYAVEEAIQLKTANSDAILKVVSIGPVKRVTTAVRTALIWVQMKELWWTQNLNCVPCHS